MSNEQIGLRKIRHIEHDDMTEIDNKQLAYNTVTGDIGYKNSNGEVETYTKKTGDASYNSVTIADPTQASISPQGQLKYDTSALNIKAGIEGSLDLCDDGTVRANNSSIAAISAAPDKTLITKEWFNEYAGFVGGEMKPVGFEYPEELSLSWSETSNTPFSITLTLTFNVDMKVQYTDKQYDREFSAGDTRSITIDLQDFPTVVGGDYPETGICIVFLGTDGNLTTSQDYVSYMPAVAIVDGDILSLSGSYELVGVVSVTDDFHGINLDLSTREYMNSRGAWVQWGLSPYRENDYTINVDEGVYVNDDIMYDVSTNDNVNADIVTTIGDEMRLSLVANSLDSDVWHSVLVRDQSGSKEYLKRKHPDGTLLWGSDPTIGLLCVKPSTNKDGNPSTNFVVLIANHDINLDLFDKDNASTNEIIIRIGDAASNMIEIHQTLLLDWAVIGAVVVTQGNTFLYSMAELNHTEIKNKLWMTKELIYSALTDIVYIDDGDIDEFRAAVSNPNISHIHLTNNFDVGDGDILLDVNGDKMITGSAIIFNNGYIGTGHIYMSSVTGYPFTLRFYNDAEITNYSTLELTNVSVKFRNIFLDNDVTVTLNAAETCVYEKYRSGSASFSPDILEYWDNTYSTTSGPTGNVNEAVFMDTSGSSGRSVIVDETSYLALNKDVRFAGTIKYGDGVQEPFWTFTSSEGVWSNFGRELHVSSDAISFVSSAGVSTAIDFHLSQGTAIRLPNTGISDIDDDTSTGGGKNITTREYVVDKITSLSWEDTLNVSSVTTTTPIVMKDYNNYGFILSAGDSLHPERSMQFFNRKDTLGGGDTYYCEIGVSDENGNVGGIKMYHDYTYINIPRANSYSWTPTDDDDLTTKKYVDDNFLHDAPTDGLLYGRQYIGSDMQWTEIDVTYPPKIIEKSNIFNNKWYHFLDSRTTECGPFSFAIQVFEGTGTYNPIAVVDVIVYGMEADSGEKIVYTLRNQDKIGEIELAISGKNNGMDLYFKFPNGDTLYNSMDRVQVVGKRVSRLMTDADPYIDIVGVDTPIHTPVYKSLIFNGDWSLQQFFDGTVKGDDPVDDDDLTTKKYVDDVNIHTIGITLLSPQDTDSFPAFITPPIAGTITHISYVASSSCEFTFNGDDYTASTSVTTDEVTIAFPANTKYDIDINTTIDDGYLTVSFTYSL